MSKSVSKSHKITWCEHVSARALDFVISTDGVWNSGIIFILSGGRAIATQPNDNRYTQAAPQVRSELLSIITRKFQGDLNKLHLSHINGHLCRYSHESQLEIIKILNRERETMKQDIAGKIPPDILGRLEAALAEVENKLTTKDPLISNHLRASHQILISYPETVHLLDDTDIANLIGAAQLHTKIEIVKATAPKTARAAAKKASVDDF